MIDAPTLPGGMNHRQVTSSERGKTIEQGAYSTPAGLLTPDGGWMNTSPFSELRDAHTKLTTTKAVKGIIESRHGGTL